MRCRGSRPINRYTAHVVFLLYSYKLRRTRSMSAPDIPRRSSHKRRREDSEGSSVHTRCVSMYRFRECMFSERHSVQATTESLQRQINALQQVIRLQDECGTLPGPGPAAPLDVNTQDGTESEPRPMSEGHPLKAFVADRLEQVEWGRARCGDVRRAYIHWQKHTHGKPGLHHIAFSQEMKKHWAQKGCPARRFYHGVQLKETTVTFPTSVPDDRGRS
jgi:hypothetical protein